MESQGWIVEGVLEMVLAYPLLSPYFSELEIQRRQQSVDAEI